MLDWKSIGRAVKHEKRLLMVSLVSLLLLGGYGIITLQNMFVSGSRILIERRGLFSETEMMAAASQDNTSRRMHAITSTVLSTDSIKTILVENKLVPAELSDAELFLSVEAFREHAVLELDNVAVVNPFTGKSGMYSQGMIIEFSHTDPDTAFAVATALTDRVLQANKGKSEAEVEYRRAYLSEQYDGALAKLAETKAAVSAFKNQNAMVLPDVNPLRVRRYEEIESQSSRIDENISRLRRDLNDVRAALATTDADAFVLAADGTRILGTDEQLRLLEAEYARAQSRYTSNHPDLAKLRAEIEGLRRYADGADSSGIEADLQQARKDLSAAQQRYSSDHPDVRSLQRKVDLFQGLLADSARKSTRTTPGNSSNPAFNRLLIREKGIIDDIARERQKKVGLAEELREIKGQLAVMPGVEQELATLLQKQEAATNNYEEIELELEQLSRSRGLRQADLLDRFLLIEPPRRPYAPSKPPKKLLLALLGVFALGASLLAAILRHAYRDLILDTDDVEDFVDLPVYIVPRFA